MNLATLFLATPIDEIVLADMTCCNDQNFMSGLTDCGCGCSSDLNPFSGLMGGLMGGTQEVWSGDAYTAIVQVGPQYAESGTGALERTISEALGGIEGNGVSYNTSVIYQTGTFNPWFMIRGNSNIDASSPDSLQNEFVAAINTGLVSAGFASAQVMSFAWKGLETHNADAANAPLNPPFHNPVDMGNRGSAPPSGNMTLQQWQDFCSQQGLVYNGRANQCECGTVDQWLVDLGVKKSCADTAFGFKSGALLVLAVGGGLFLLSRRF